MSQQNQQFTAFLLAWHRSGITFALASHLLPLAEQVGLSLAGTTRRAHLISLGQLLSRNVGVEYQSEGLTLTVERAAIDKGQRYELSTTIHSEAPTMPAVGAHLGAIEFLQ